MSSIVNRPRGHKWIQFTGLDGKRKTIRLGKQSKANAVQFQRHVDNLLADAMVGESAGPRDTAWLEGLSDLLRGRLAATGLAKPTVRHTIAELLTGFEASLDVKESTANTISQALRNVRAYCDQSDDISLTDDVRQITEAQAEAFKKWLGREGGEKGGKLAKATVSRRCRRVRQILELAVKSRWIEKNPFAVIKGGSEANRERDFFVDRKMFARILAATPDAEFRLILALARFAGLRCPGEVVPMRWSAINWAEDRINVFAPKTAHHEAHAVRQVPIFAEIRPYLEDLWEAAPKGADLMFPNHQVSSAALTKKLRKITDSLGIPSWKKPFTNMRATCDTEMNDKYPVHVCVAWLGHSAKVARAHYLQVSDDHWASASGTDSKKEPTPPVGDPKQKPKHRNRS